jgi:chlorobactene glucosyltransferase
MIQTLLIITICVFCAWLYLFAYMVKSLKQTPRLDSIDPCSLMENDNDRVSIIIPARNEEKYIAKCIDSLLKQDYTNFEIIVINDSSDDGTWNVIGKYADNYKESIIAVNADAKPYGWTGKSWACYQGFLKATGNILMFTDADTIHSQSVLSLAIKYLTEQKLDVLTVIPRLVCEDIWTRMTLPLIWTISYIRYSPLRANNQRIKLDTCLVASL